MALRTNALKQSIAQGKTVAGPVMQLASPELIEMAGVAGFDFGWIDCEHGSFYLEQAVAMVRAADAVGMTALIRVPNQDTSFIMRALDTGAMGVVVPNVSTEAQTRAVVSATRYKFGDNGGTRGACPGSRATWHQAADWKAYAEHANSQVLVWVIIETVEALRNIEGILAVTGLDAVVLGPFDLAHEMGHAGEVTNSEVVSALDRVADLARAAGVTVVASFFASTTDGIAAERERWLNRGVHVFSIGSDRRLILNAMRDRSEAAHG